MLAMNLEGHTPPAQFLKKKFTTKVNVQTIKY